MAIYLNTIPETATKLRVSKPTVYRLIATGALESCDVSTPGSRTSKTRVSDDAIAAFVRKRTRSSRRRRAV